jgi:hypothetical protein
MLHTFERDVTAAAAAVIVAAAAAAAAEGLSCLLWCSS